MISEEHPQLISCIMPTYNRRAFVPKAIRYFLRQNYPNKELIIIDDGTDPVHELVPDNPGIRYYRLDKKITLGAKMNLACTYAKGPLIANWDDDDWYANWRLMYQVESLENDGSDVCGINKLLYYDLLNKKAFQYIYPGNQRPWLLGSSLCFKYELWKNNQFAEIDVGMDGLFIRNTPSHRVKVLNDHRFSVHMVHQHNISPKKTSGALWHNYPVEEIKTLMAADWDLYHPNNGGAIKPKNSINSELNTAIKVSTSFKNIYACLVHEKEDCLVDLVQNLYYNDPLSTILVYNGGTNPDLIPKDFPFEKFGAIVHPHSKPAQHGYLHNFALDCMNYAVDHFSFDTITIVDSDQLSIRKNYSEYLSNYLSSLSNVGMLSSNPPKVGKENRSNFVASKAHKEYELWKPFIKSFPGGEDKFVHWTFWPSTVFSFNACRDLVIIFKENKELQEIMIHTKIWATEEVILPTIVSLLGYNIFINPCSYDYVRYRKPISKEDLKKAIQKKETYWLHPVERKYDDPIRRLIRESSNDYFNRHIPVSEKSAEMSFPILPLITTVRRIQGWLSDKEAELLARITLQALRLIKSSPIVEVGSYHGKSTVIFGTILKELFPDGKLIAIDTHDGKLGAQDQGLKSFPSSLGILKKNISETGISDFVEIIQDKAWNIKWNLPVSLLFIDGLHDYRNVAKDFNHFSEWIVPDGYIAFHDYTDYFPGVKILVDDLLESASFRKVQLVDSLMVMQKV